MQAWTKELSEMFPTLREIASRPWWTPDKEGSRSGEWVRRDGVRVECFAPLSTDWRSETEMVEAAALVDKTNPLPHPGYRVGQVWARASGESRVVQMVGAGVPYVLGEGGGVFPLGGKDGEPQAIRLTYAVAVAMPEDFCFLVADPACPHLAPWASVEPNHG